MRIRFEGTIKLDGELTIDDTTPPPDPEPEPTGRWRTSGSQIIDPAGRPWHGPGMNVSVGMSADGQHYPYVFEGRGDSQVDVWDGMPPPGIFPGGPVGSVGAWSPALRRKVLLPSRIPQMRDTWQQRIARVNCVPRGANDKPHPADSIPWYVVKVEELLDAGMIVMAECHNQTGQNLDIGSSDKRMVDAIQFQGRLLDHFRDARSSVWYTLPNEPWSTLPDKAYQRWVVQQVEQVRAITGNNIICVPLACWGQDLGGIARGDYDNLAAQVGGNIVWEWHAYGADWRWGKPTGYTYQRMDDDLSAAADKGFPIVIGEYGQSLPASAGNAGPWQWNVEAVNQLFSGGLIDKHKISPIVWHACGDDTTKKLYSLTYGTHKGDAGNGDGTGIPFWKIDGDHLDWLSPLGRAHWDISHAIAKAQRP